MLSPRAKQFVKRFGVVRRIVGRRRARETEAFREWWLALPEGAAGGDDSTSAHEDTGAPDARSLSAPGEPTRVLMVTSLGGWQPGTRLDSTLAVALRQRDAEVAVWLCDEALPACQLADAYFYPRQTSLIRNRGPRDLCRTCFAPAAKLFEDLCVPVHRLGKWLTAEDRDRTERLATEIELSEIPTFELDGIPLGEHALSGALRFFARGDLDGEPLGEEMLRVYLRAALRTYHSIRRLLESETYDCAVLHHGIYVPQGTIAETCRRRGVRVVTWHPAYRRNCFTFAEGDTYHRAMITEPVDRWEGMEWSEKHEAAIMDYLHSRRTGSRDWISFNREPEEQLSRIADDLGLDRERPWIGLLTTVMWDARLHYPNNAFPGVWEWVESTIRYFSRREDLQLVIRVHPAELRARLPARQRMVDEIRRCFPRLPENVAVIPPESRISSYVLLENCDAALIYATKMGLELTAAGVPTVVAGEAWVRGKGISIDADTSEDYARILGRLPLGREMAPEQVARARKYAYHYFFRRMIPLDFVSQPSARSLAFDVKIKDLGELRPGVHRGLDVICDGILCGSPFIYPAEREVASVAASVEEPEPHQAAV